MHGDVDLSIHNLPRRDSNDEHCLDLGFVVGNPSPASGRLKTFDEFEMIGLNCAAVGLLQSDPTFGLRSDQVMRSVGDKSQRRWGGDCFSGQFEVFKNSSKSVAGQPKEDHVGRGSRHSTGREQSGDAMRVGTGGFLTAGGEQPSSENTPRPRHPILDSHRPNRPCMVLAPTGCWFPELSSDA